MKQAEEWEEFYWTDVAGDMTHADYVRRIQSDARRQGMLDAVEACDQLATQYQATEGTYAAGKKAGAFACKSFIEQAAERLEGK